MSELTPAEWLLNAVATASQHPALNPYSSAYDGVLAQAILDNGRRLEQRVQRAEAECERLRSDMEAIFEESRALRQGGPFAEDALELHDALERAVEIAANATPPPEGEMEGE